MNHCGLASLFKEIDKNASAYRYSPSADLRWDSQHRPDGQKPEIRLMAKQYMKGYAVSATELKEKGMGQQAR